MTANNTYIQDYASKFTAKITADYFSKKKYMTGPQLVQLTPCKQVNFFAIKSLFEAWQTELEKLKSNPYFDYRDNTVHKALIEFMNVLSRSIKVKQKDFEPLLKNAVIASIHLALDPLDFYNKEFEKVVPTQLNAYLKENVKYFKWHKELVENIIDRAGLAHTQEAFKEALNQNYSKFNTQLEPAEELLKSLGKVCPLDLSLLIASQKEIMEVNGNSDHSHREENNSTTNGHTHQEDKDSSVTVLEEPSSVKTEPQESVSKSPSGDKLIDSQQIWAKFESEEYAIMKGSIKELSESIGINQKIMFTKSLFQSNQELMNHALESVDSCNSFADAIQLLNEKYVAEMNWDKNSDEVNEFLQLIFRKFDDRG